MSQQILQLNFNFNATADEYENLVSPMAQDFSEVSGLQWKIWLMNKEKREAGGIYLFESEEAVENFKQTPLVAAVMSHPVLSNITVKQFDVLEKPSSVTNAPLTMAGVL